MTASLTAAQALDYLTVLSADIQAAAVLDARRRSLAGDAALAAAAADLPPNAHGRAGDRQVHVASDQTHTVVIVTGRFALPGLARHDLTAALRAMAPVADEQRRGVTLENAAPQGQNRSETAPTSIEPDTLKALLASVFGATEPRKRPSST